VLLICAAAHLAGQAHAGNVHFAADPRHPYCYAQTGEDVFLLARRLEKLAQAHPAGLSVPVQVISRANLWPLPWYLRRFSGVVWWSGFSPEAPRAPIVLVTPDMEGALISRLYEEPPPGERELFTSIFDGTVELRPGVELRGFAAQTLWDAYRRREADGAHPLAEE
jgi:hypothetical protein